MEAKVKQKGHARLVGNDAARTKLEIKRAIVRSRPHQSRKQTENNPNSGLTPSLPNNPKNVS